MNKYTIRKWNGDDLYSWALFKNGVPILTGMDRSEARYELKMHQEKEKK